MGAGPLSCAVFRATLLLMHNLSQTSVWSATTGFPSAWFAVSLEVCTLDSGWDPLSRLHLDEGQTRGREEGRSLCLRLWAELPQALPTCGLSASVQQETGRACLRPLGQWEKREASQAPSLKRK